MSQRPSRRPRALGPRLPLVLALAAAIAASSGAETRPTSTPLQGAILVLIDTARADHLTPYGHERNTSPALRDLAARGVLFEQVVSYAPWTLPSVAAMLSGDRFTRAYDVAEGKLRRSVVEEIQRAGYTTAAITEGGFVSSHFAFDRGFDEFREERGAVIRQDDAGESVEAGKASVVQTFAQAQQWLRRHTDERFFLLIHTYEPHTPYERLHFTKNVPRGEMTRVFDGRMLARVRGAEVGIGVEERRYVSALYDGGLHMVDRELAALMKGLVDMGLGDRTLLVVTSDHGEDLGSRNPKHLGDHGQTLFDEQILVPLVIADPTRSFARRRVTTQVRTIDILPTVADLLDVPLPGPIEGRSLVPVTQGEEKAGRVAFGGVTKLTPARYFVRDSGYKYIESSASEGVQDLSPAPPPIQLYDLRADPGERKNLARHDPERVRYYHKLLKQYLSSSQDELAIESATEDVDPALRERLRSLGYVE